MALDKNAVAKEAQKFVAKGMYDKAIAEWKRLVRESPNDATIFNTIGDLCLKKNAKADAVEAYKRAADILADDGFTSKAIALYKKVLNIDPEKFEVHLALGDMNAEKGLIGNALENYKNVADYYKKQNKMAEALGIYQKMADLNPANVAFQLKLAEMYTKEKMPDAAAKAYLAAADVHIAKNAFQDARQLFEKVLALDPDNKDVYHKAGVLYIKEGKFTEASKALKRAFESDPRDTALANTYLEALIKAGREADAESVMKRLLAEDMGRTDLREKLYAIYLTRRDFERALVEATALADARTEAGDRQAAEEIYLSYLAACPEYAPGRQRLAELYISFGRSADAGAELVKAAGLYIDEGDRDLARAVLNQAIEVSPAMTEARTLLDTLQGGPTAAPAKPAEPTIEFMAPGERPELPIEPVVPEEPAPAAQPEAVEWRPPTEPAPEETAPPAPIPAPVSEDEPAVLEALTETDVLVKYGLTTKAIEQLEAVSSTYPENTRIRIRLRDLYHASGGIDKAVVHALLAMALLTKQGRDDVAADVLESTRVMAPDHPAIVARLRRSAAGQAQPEGPEVTAVPPAEPVEASLPETVIAQEPAFEAQAEVPVFMDSAPEPALEQPAREQPGEITFDDLDTGIAHFDQTEPAEEVPSGRSAHDDHGLLDDEVGYAPPGAGVPAPGLLDLEQPAPLSAPGSLPEEELPAEQGSSVQGTPAAEEPAVPVQPAPAPVYAQAPPAESDTNEIWAEAEFYFQQGLFDEAKKYYARIISITPGDRRAIDRLSEITREEDETREFSKLADAVEGLEEYASQGTAEGELAASESDEEAVRSLMQEIQQMNRQRETTVAPPPPPPPPPPPQAPPEPIARPAAPAAPRPSAAPPSRPAPPREEQFVDLGVALTEEPAAARGQGGSSDDFFDLAAELRDELSTSPAAPKKAEASSDQSLDDIFEEFKKGVQQQTIKEDADTHYNLGVAYKEMGLLDDAIGEFIMTPEDEPKFVQSRYMLGLCYMEQGDYQSAIGEIQNALDYADTLGGGEGLSRIEMHYDLGLAHQGAGSIDNAINQFQRVMEMDPSYRDAAAKLRELHKGDFISLDQLKDDIEKEISSKFLEEGSRIEREEKIRKNERIKS